MSAACGPEPSWAECQQFVSALFRYADDGTYASLRAFDQFDRARPPEFIWPVEIKGDDLSGLIDRAAEGAKRCATADHSIVFAPPICTFSNPKRARGVDLANGLTLSVELDDGDTLAALQRLEGLLGAATLVIASGGSCHDPATGKTHDKLHLHWRLSEPTRSDEEHQKLRQARDYAARLVGADPTGKPVNHPLRWPGSWNTKDPTQPRMARIIAANDAAEVHLDEAFEALADAIEAAGCAEIAPHKSSGTPEAPLPLLQSAMAAVPNPELHYDDWIRFGYASWHATGGADAGFDLWDNWSRKSAKYNAANTADAWGAISRAIGDGSAPRPIGAGTIFYFARQAGWKRPDPADDPGNIASLEAEAQRHQPRQLSQPQPANGQADDNTMPVPDAYTHFWVGPAGNIPCTPTGVEWADTTTGRTHVAVWATDEEDPTLARRSVAPADELIPATDPSAAWQAPKHGHAISVDIPEPDGGDDQPSRGSSGNGASVPDFEPGYAESLDEADEPAPPSNRAILKIKKGEYVAIAEHIEAVATAAQLPVYSHGEALCHPVTEQRKRYDGDEVTVAVLRNYNAASLRRAIDPAIGFSKFDGRRKAFVACEPPHEIINMVLAGGQKQIFPPIRGIIATPILRPDHTIVTTPGYDPKTGYYLVNPPRMPPIPAAPTRADATKALAVLKDLLSEFPFADDVSRCVAYSGLITPLVRAACDVVPGHLFTAPQQGSGKSLLLDTAAALATGERAYAILAHRDLKEQDKQLAAAVLEGRQIIALDNLSGEIESAVLAQITERERVSVRLFGTLDAVAVLNGFNTYLTGNNLTIAGDNVRRLLVSRIQPNVENPLDRTFQKQNPVLTVLHARGKFVHACLTIVLAYIAEGRPNPKQLQPTPSYQAWSELVREPLVWLGLPDPTDSMRTAFDDDPNNAALAVLIAAWPTSQSGWTCAELIDAATGNSPCPGLTEALKPIARDRSGFFDAAVLGIYLRRNRDRIVAGKKISRVSTTHGGAARWQCCAK